MAKLALLEYLKRDEMESGDGFAIMMREASKVLRKEFAQVGWDQPEKPLGISGMFKVILYTRIGLLACSPYRLQIDWVTTPAGQLIGCKGS